MIQTHTSRAKDAGGCNACTGPDRREKVVVIRLRKWGGLEVRLCLDCAADLKARL